MRAVNAAFNDGAKLVTRIRDDRLETDRALPEEPTRDLLDSLQLGPVLVKGQYDRDLRRFGEPFVCGDGQAREQMKDVLINLQMALIISLRGISMDDGDIDFESLQQTSDDCRTNAGVCLGQLSQRLSDTAKAQALFPETEMMRLPAAQPPKNPSLAYSSSRSTRSTRSSGRDPRTPPDSIHENFASMSVASNSTTIRPHTQERKRSNSTASKRGYQSRGPSTAQSQSGSRAMPMIAIPPANYSDGRGSRLRHAPSHEVLTPPDEDSLAGYRHGYLRHHGSQEEFAAARGSGSNPSDAAYQNPTYAGRRQPAPSVISSRSNGSRSRQPYTYSNLGPSQAPTERSASKARFGGISSDPVSSNGSHPNHFDMSALDDPTTSEEEDIISMRRPSSHALGIDEHELLSPPRPQSPAQSFVVSLPDVDHQYDAPVSPISPISEQEHSDHDSILAEPQLLSAHRYHPLHEDEDEAVEDHNEGEKVNVDDTTPTLGPGEFGYATVYETSRIKPVEAMPRYDPSPRARQPRQDSLSRLRESRLYGVDGMSSGVANGRATPLRSPEATQATIRAAESRVRHYRNRPAPPAQTASDPSRSTRLEHVAYMQQEGRLPKQFQDLPLPPTPLNENRPNSRNSGRHMKAQQGYKVFPTTSAAARGAPHPPPSMAPPPPPSAPQWADAVRPSTSPGPPNDLPPITPASMLRPTTSATTDNTPEALPQGEPGPVAAEESSEEEIIVKPKPKQPRMVKIVPLDMAMYGGIYTAPTVPKPKKVKPAAPPMPVTLPLVLPTEKHLQGFCKGAHRAFVGQNSKGFSVSSRPYGLSSNIPLWQCTKCHFQGPLTTVSVERRLGKKKEQQIFDPKVRTSPVKGTDGQVGGVRYKWVFLAKCHVRLKTPVDWLTEPKRAKAGEVGGFG